MLLAILWFLLAASLLLACVSAYFYWFSGNTTIQNMLGFYTGTFGSIIIFTLILLLKFFYFVT